MLRLDQECCCVEKGRTLSVDIVLVDEGINS